MEGNQIGIIITILLYLCGMIFIGYRTLEKNKTVGDFYLGGRQLGPLVTAMSAEASDMSSWLLMGLPGVAYISGISDAGWTAIGLAAGTYLNWLIVAKRLRRYTEKIDAITLPEFFSKRYHDATKLLMLISALWIIVFFVPYTASGFVACGKLFNSLFGVNYHVAMIVSAIIIILYTTLGGFLAASTTDFVQSIVMSIALIVILLFGVNVAGGLDAVIKNAAELPGYLSMTHMYDATAQTSTPYSLLTIVSTCAWGLGYFGMPHILLRFMAIEDENKVIDITFQVKAIDNGEVVPADSDRTEEVKAAYYKPDIDILNFSFLKSDDGIDYEEFDGYYKLWLSRKDGEWGFLPEGAEERVPDVVGSGTSLEYNLVENFIGDLSNPITAYRLDLYRDAEYTQLLDSETIPVLYDDEQIRIDMTNDNVSLVANSSGEVISYLPTASNIAVYKGKDKLEYSNTALTTLIQNLGDAKAQYYYNIEITPVNCTGQTITSTDPKNILLGSISDVTDVDLMFAYRTITIKYIMIGKKLVGFSGSGRNIKPKYQRTHKIEESSVVQAIAIVKNGETRKLKFAVGPFGLNTSSETDMSTLTWYDNMPVRTSSQCIYMAVENTTQSSN